jgi:hypothetical protein
MASEITGHAGHAKATVFDTLNLLGLSLLAVPSRVSAATGPGQNPRIGIKRTSGQSRLP